MLRLEARGFGPLLLLSKAGLRPDPIKYDVI
jgi:hypothetical protein